jgi:hypothetical protein
MQTRRIDPRATGPYWSARLENLLRGSIGGRKRIPDGQVLDVRFDRFMADEAGTVTQVLELAGLQIGPDVCQRIESWATENPRGKHGTVSYRLESFGLDAAERRGALRFYQDAFDVPDEP